jgi:hypothetical protein
MTANGLTAPATCWGFFFVPAHSSRAATRLKTPLVMGNDPLDHFEWEIAYWNR